jgi:hypothetical protein
VHFYLYYPSRLQFSPKLRMLIDFMREWRAREAAVKPRRDAPKPHSVITPVTADPNVAGTPITRYPHARRTRCYDNATCLRQRATQHSESDQENRKITAHGVSPRE